jgi:hypothetical protein
MLPKINNEKVRNTMRKAIGIAWGMEEPSPELRKILIEQGDLVEEELR